MAFGGGHSHQQRPSEKVLGFSELLLITISCGSSHWQGGFGERVLGKGHHLPPESSFESSGDPAEKSKAHFSPLLF